MTRDPIWDDLKSHFKAKFDADRARASGAAMSTAQWERMRSAPTDGTRVLLYLPKYGPFTAHWDGGWHVHGCEHLHASPSHWMQLPKKPEQE